MRPDVDDSIVSAGEAADSGGGEVGDGREKHVRVLTRSGERIDHGEVYFRHSSTHFVVSPEGTFPEAETERYAKETLLRVEVTQHHAACFITTATAGRGASLDSLRGFRDDAMAATPVGRALVGLYYAVSPPIADTLARHPGARTTATVRWLVERCGALARRRAATRSPAVRLAASVVLTLTYAVGLLVAVVGHLVIVARERVAGE